MVLLEKYEAHNICSYVFTSQAKLNLDSLRGYIVHNHNMSDLIVRIQNFTIWTLKIFIKILTLCSQTTKALPQRSGTNYKAKELWFSVREHKIYIHCDNL